jgi:hypothetical protein
MVTLAQIFMSTPNPNRDDRQKHIIEEWDGKNPGHTKTLFVYACIDNSTYANYVSVPTLKQNQRAKNTDRGEAFIPEYVKVMQQDTREGIISCLSSPRVCSYPSYPELKTLLPNLMCGIISVDRNKEETEVEADLVHMNRIYMLDIPPTLGLEYTQHFAVTKPEFTYWYRLNDGYNGDKLTGYAPLGSTVSVDWRDLESDSSKSKRLNPDVPIYKIFRNFRPDNADLFKFHLETGFLKAKKRRSSSPIPDTAGGKKHSKKRNKTRRKYRKIKSRRRRVVR